MNPLSQTAKVPGAEPLAPSDSLFSGILTSAPADESINFDAFLNETAFEATGTVLDSATSVYSPVQNTGQLFEFDMGNYATASPMAETPMVSPLDLFLDPQLASPFVDQTFEVPMLRSFSTSSSAT
ncbi:hypothetical protein HDU91_007016, partial [Kappamyces sp. JEL0680]